MYTRGRILSYPFASLVYLGMPSIIIYVRCGDRRFVSSVTLDVILALLLRRCWKKIFQNYYSLTLGGVQRVIHIIVIIINTVMSYKNYNILCY